MSENLSSHSSYYEEVLNTAAAAMALNKDNDKHDRKNINSNSNSNNSNNTNGHGNDNSNNNNGAKTNLTGGRKFTTTRIINNHNNNGNNEMNSSFDSNFSANYDNDNQNHNYYDNDNDNDNENGNDEGNKNTNTNTNANTSIISMTEEDAAMLSSLPKQPIANFPIEADRKRIIGCLAAILAMMFDHEKKGLLNYSPVFDDDDDNDDDGDDGNGDKNSHEGSIHLEANNNHNNNFSLEDSIEMEAEESFDESSKSNMSNSTDKQSKRWGGRRGKKNNNINNNNNNSNSSNNSNNNNNTSNNKNISKNKKLEQERYKRRRHEVYSSFLIFSAELLFLDKSNAVAFLPLLNSLLGENQPTFNGVKVGVGVGVNSSSGSTLNSNNNTTKSRGVQTKRKNGGKQNDIVQPDDNKEMNTLLRGWDTSPNDKKQQYHQQSNTNANANTNTNHYPHHQSVEFETYIGINDEDKPNEQTWDNNDLLIPFVESLNPGAGFQCLSLLLMNYLLRSQVGYDARIRHILKKLGLVVIAHEMKVSGDYEQKNDDALAKLATRKFEALENSVASKLLKLSNTQQEAAASKEGAADGEVSKTKKSMSMENFVRGLKVGSVGIAAGTLFAVTGGLAAPGIAAGLAASGLTATAAAASIVTTLTSTAAVTTIFGVGGGSLTAYKTHRRIKGLTEFTFNKEGQGKKSKENNEIDGNLFSTICISGWLTDEKDFQRPWGVEPTNPPISDWTEKLMRFYAVYNPDNVSRCNDILKKWKGEERQLWLVLRQKYGRDPDHLYPLQNNLQRSPMSFFENEIVDNLLKELGYALLGEDKEVSNNVGTAGGLVMLKKKTQTYNTNNAFATDTLSTTPNTPLTGTSSSRRAEIAPCHSSNLFESFDERPKYNGEHESTKETNSLAHDIWDFQGEYGGELLTVRWESDLLIELCDSVTDMAVDMVGTAAKEILKQTALSTLITAIAWPYGLVRAASMIDGTWTLAIERSDLAGIELARSLLESKAGHRPVVLVGFSMGARTVYSCLKELARHQQLWEDQQILRKNEKKVRIGLKKKKNKDADAIKYTREPASIVEDAIMMGLPNHLSLHSWENCRSVVAGRLINCYAGRDLILSLMFQIKRLSGALKTVCGTSPVNVAGVENYDVSNFISAHSDYCKMTGRILRMINHGCPYRPSAVITVPNEFGRKYD